MDTEHYSLSGLVTFIVRPFKTCMLTQVLYSYRTMRHCRAGRHFLSLHTAQGTYRVVSELLYTCMERVSADVIMTDCPSGSQSVVFRQPH